MPEAVRYTEGNHAITMMAEILREPPVNRSWLRRLLARSYLAISIETPLRWDNDDQAMPFSHEELVIERVKQVLEAKTSRFVIYRTALDNLRRSN